MPSMDKIVAYWRERDDDWLSGAYELGWDEPFCFACGWLPPSPLPSVDHIAEWQARLDGARDSFARGAITPGMLERVEARLVPQIKEALRELDAAPDVAKEARAAWRRAGRWLDRAHLWDAAGGGPNEPFNLVPLCHLCHMAYPMSDSTEFGLEWVKAREDSQLLLWQIWTDSRLKDVVPARNATLRGERMAFLLCVAEQSAEQHREDREEITRLRQTIAELRRGDAA